MSVNVLLSVSCESMCICRQELLFLALARHFHLIEVQGSEGLGEDPPHSLSSPRLQHKFIVEMRMHMLIPKSIQTLFGNGDSPYGNIRLSLPSPCPFPYRDSPYGNGERIFGDLQVSH